MNITLADEDRRIKLNVLNSSLIQKQLRVLTLNKLTGNLSSAVIGVMQRKKESIVLWLRLFSWRIVQKITEKPLPMNASIRGIPNDCSKFRKCLAAILSVRRCILQFPDLFLYCTAGCIHSPRLLTCQKSRPFRQPFAAAKNDLNFEQNRSKMPPIRSMLRIPAHELLASPYHRPELTQYILN